MNFNFKVICLFAVVTSISCSLTAIRDLVQFNVFGIPALHKEVNWSFDPDVGKRRSRQYQELNGKYGDKAIERLGLGIDGRDLERQEKQRERDRGQLGGVNYIVKEFL